MINAEPQQPVVGAPIGAQPENGHLVKGSDLKDLINPILQELLPFSPPPIVKEVLASELITGQRFDLMAKQICAQHYLESSEQRDVAEQIYLAHIKILNGGVECYENGPSKKTPREFLHSFYRLLEEMKCHGFDPQESIIPVDKEMTIIDGSHRVAAAIALNQKVTIAQFDYPVGAYDHAFFNQRGMPLSWLDRMAIQYLALSPNTSLALLTASKRHHLKQVMRDLKGTKDIVFMKLIHPLTGGHMECLRGTMGNLAADDALLLLLLSGRTQELPERIAAIVERIDNRRSGDLFVSDNSSSISAMVPSLLEPAAYDQSRSAHPSCWDGRSLRFMFFYGCLRLRNLFLFGSLYLWCIKGTERMRPTNDRNDKRCGTR